MVSLIPEIFQYFAPLIRLTSKNQRIPLTIHVSNICLHAHVISHRLRCHVSCDSVRKGSSCRSGGGSCRIMHTTNVPSSNGFSGRLGFTVSPGGLGHTYSFQVSNSFTTAGLRPLLSGLSFTLMPECSIALRNLNI